MLGPPDIESRIGLTGGNIFQGEVTPDQMWEGRLPARTPVPGLYLCGAATHPAGSVIALNGRNAAAAVLADPARAGGRLGGSHLAAAVERRAESTRERILEAACDLIAAEGIDDVRIARVATRAGASTALVHHYFSTREELLEQALIHSFEQAGDERFGEPPEADESADRRARAGDRRVPAPARAAGARVGAVGGAVAARRARARPAPGRRPALRALPRVAGGADPGRAPRAASSDPSVDLDAVADVAMALLDGAGVRALIDDPAMDVEAARALVAGRLASELGIDAAALAEYASA